MIYSWLLESCCGLNGWNEEKLRQSPPQGQMAKAVQIPAGAPPGSRWLISAWRGRQTVASVQWFAHVLFIVQSIMNGFTPVKVTAHLNGILKNIHVWENTSIKTKWLFTLDKVHIFLFHAYTLLIYCKSECVWKKMCGEGELWLRQTHWIRFMTCVREYQSDSEQEQPVS